MPINKREFQLGIDKQTKEFMENIYSLLESKRDLAFSTSELVEEVHTNIIDPRFAKALAVLVEINAVQKRRIGDLSYYAFSEEFNKDTWTQTEEVPF